MQACKGSSLIAGIAMLLVASACGGSVTQTTQIATTGTTAAIVASTATTIPTTSVPATTPTTTGTTAAADATPAERPGTWTNDQGGGGNTLILNGSKYELSTGAGQTFGRISVDANEIKFSFASLCSGIGLYQ